MRWIECLQESTLEQQNLTTNTSFEWWIWVAANVSTYTFKNAPINGIWHSTVSEIGDETNKRHGDGRALGRVKAAARRCAQVKFSRVCPGVRSGTTCFPDLFEKTIAFSSKNPPHPSLSWVLCHFTGFGHIVAENYFLQKKRFVGKTAE